ITIPAAANPMNAATQIARTQLPRSHTLRRGPPPPAWWTGPVISSPCAANSAPAFQEILDQRVDLGRRQTRPEVRGHDAGRVARDDDLPRVGDRLPHVVLRRLAGAVLGGVGRQVVEVGPDGAARVGGLER